MIAACTPGRARGGPSARCIRDPRVIPHQQRKAAALLQDWAGAAPIETHISAVFRGADLVWKIKKAVRLSYVDFTDIENRRRYLQRELALNAAAAPGLYRDVVPVCAGGRVLDWALRMARVPETDFLDRVAADGRLDGPMLDALADAVADLHAALPPAPVIDPAPRMLAVVTGNAAAARAAGLDPAQVAAWQDGIAPTLRLNQALLAARAAAGLVRRAHGDLHLGNLLLWRGRPAPFDALEFDEALATVDLGYDLAFLLMDLDVRAGRPAANRVLSRYVGRTGDAGLVGALPAFLSLRAMVRAHVTRDAAYLTAALAYLHPAPPVLVAVGGLMGSGKTTLARQLAPALGAAPGALVLRSDEIRKRLHGVAPEQALPPGAYDAEGNARTDAALLDMARTALAGGHAVVADATFLDPALRTRMEAAADTVPFKGLWLHVPLDTLERRIAARSGDASDATIAVLHAALPRSAPPRDWQLIDTDAPEYGHDGRANPLNPGS